MIVNLQGVKEVSKLSFRGDGVEDYVTEFKLEFVPPGGTTWHEYNSGEVLTANTDATSV